MLQIMDAYVVLLAIFVCHLLVGHGGVEGRLILSKEEDMELDRQLKLLNKPAITTIQMEPTSPLSKRKGDDASSKVDKSFKVGLKGGGCPWGTVPIRKTTKEDLIRQKLVSIDDTNVDYAKVETESEPNNNLFMGAGGVISLHNPLVTGQQYSAAVLKVAKGDDSIQAGWRVDPTLYGDNRTRLFIRVDAGESHCFNTQCPGFVLVRSDVPLDFVFSNTSMNKILFETQVNFQRDSANGNWWLFFGFGNIPVGFWPQRIFTGLANVADLASWGGEIFSPSGTSKPPMGAGTYPVVDTSKSAYFREIAVALEDGPTVDAYNTQKLRSSNISNVIDYKDAGSDFRHLVLYGGPGGVI